MNYLENKGSNLKTYLIKLSYENNNFTWNIKFNGIIKS
ncbi:MAG: hypothetical protein KatS3mg095_0370 [Candidatus Parcubacteria bacterium]|nr:MAG: hypothetical protein KatS3mg095_0370 [Candidatus Parcubacteria bacterium]